MSRTGILGGTFDPLHNAHIALALEAKKQFNLDSVWLMPSPDPPHKSDKKKTPFSIRYKMTLAGLEGINGLVCSDYEAGLPQPSYTVQTLQNLKKDYPDDEFMFIIGEDSLDNIENWYHPEEIMKLTELIVAARDDGDNRSLEEQTQLIQKEYGAVIHILKWKEINISSTEIRRRVASGESIDSMVPEGVKEIIWKENLYTT